MIEIWYSVFDFLTLWEYFFSLIAAMVIVLVVLKRLPAQFLFYAFIHLQTSLHCFLTLYFAKVYKHNLELFHYQNAITISLSLYFISTQLSSKKSKIAIRILLFLLLLIDFYSWNAERYSYPVVAETISLVVLMLVCMYFFIELFVSEKIKNIRLSMVFWSISERFILSASYLWTVMNWSIENDDFQFVLSGICKIYSFLISIFLFGIILTQFFLSKQQLKDSSL
jgi:hypothetical protein